MRKFFQDNFFWSKEYTDYVGMPRPALEVPENYRTKNNVKFLKKNNFYLHKKVPVPWQSKPVLNKFMAVFNVIEENEKRVYIEDRCGYCGNVFNKDDNVVRWLATDAIPNDGKGPRVFSDTHPLHIECMDQARIFCPYMRVREDKEFEFGNYSKLKKDAIVYMEKVKENTMNRVYPIKDVITDEQAKNAIDLLEKINDTSNSIRIVENKFRKTVDTPKYDELYPMLKELSEIVKQTTRDFDLVLWSYTLSKYMPGFFMDPHVDDDGEDDHNQYQAVIYLNSDFSGGDIVLPDHNFRHSPKSKDFVIFPSSYTHEVKIIDSGTRYAMTLCFTHDKELELDFIK